MSKFELPSFNTPANSKKYRDNFDAVFGKKKKKDPKVSDKAEDVEEIVIEEDEDEE
jgi:hypothetical protein